MTTNLFYKLLIFFGFITFCYSLGKHMAMRKSNEK